MRGNEVDQYLASCPTILHTDGCSDRRLAELDRERYLGSLEDVLAGTVNSVVRVTVKHMFSFTPSRGSVTTTSKKNSES